jgi:signal transduction histidine kinase
MKVDKIPVFTNDRTSIVCLYIDNTEHHMLKKNVEEATLAKNLSEKVMSDFILNMQHDIRTPLAGIVGLGDVVLSMGPDEMSDVHGAVKDMVNSASRLLTYCESMVDLHKIQDEVDRCEPEPTLIDDLIRGIFEIEKPAADAKGIKIIQMITPTETRCIVNRNKLERVLVNLVSNAIKFTEKGQVEVISELIRNDNSREALLRIKVKDSGIGIDESNLDYVFQQFSKLKPSYSETGGGLTLGFGLRLAKIFVNELGGDLTLNSKKGKGSTFTVDVPVLLPLTSMYNVSNAH